MLILISLAQFITVIGSEFTKFAIPIWLYEKNGSALSVTTAFVIAFLPNLILGPLVGSFVDHVSKKRILIFCEFGQASAMFLLFYLVSQASASTSRLFLVYVALGVQSVFALFQYPAMAAISPRLFKGRRLELINSVLSIFESMSLTLGPVLAGFSMQFLALPQFLLIDACSFVLSGLLLLFLPRDGRATDRLPNFGDVWRSSLKGFRLLRGSPVLLRFLLLGTSVNFALSLSIGLINPYLNLIFSGDLGRVGMANGCAGAMELAGAAAVTFIPRVRRRARFQLWCILALGILGTMTIGAASNPYVSASGYAVTLFTLALMNTVNRSAWQGAVPREDLGKFFAIKRMVSSSVAPLGFLLSGLLFDGVFKTLLKFEAADSFRGLFLLTAAVLVAVFVFNIQKNWIEEFDATNVD